MTFETSLIFVISLILLWIKPGPGIALRLTYALQHGFVPAFLISVGVTIVCVGYFLLAVLGYQVISTLSLLFFTILKSLGALYLIYLGLKSLKSRNRIFDKNQFSRVNEKSKPLKDLSLGLMMALSNPIAIFYFIGILPTLVPLGEMEIQDMVLGVFLIIGVGLLSDALMILLTVMTKNAFLKDGYLKYITIFTGACFVLIGLFLLCSALFLQSGMEYSFT